MFTEHPKFDAYVIETTVPITNPNADRRSKDRWEKAPVIPAGSRFIVNWSPEGGSIRSSGYGYGHEYIGSPLGKHINACCKKVEPRSIREIKAVIDCDVDGDAFLRELLKMGRITVDDLRAAGEAINTEYDANNAA